MTSVLRDRLATAIAGVALALGIGVLLFGTYETGLRLVVSDGRIYIGEVARFSQAEADGLRQGMVVTSLNNVQLIRLPQPIYGEIDESTGEQPVIGVEPAEPTDVGLTDDQLVSLAESPIQFIEVIESYSLETGNWEAGWAMMGAWYPGTWQRSGTALALLPGLTILLLGSWWVATGRAGESLRDLGIPLAVATAVPLLVQPMHSVGSPVATAGAGIVSAIGMLPLAGALLERIGDPAERRLVGLGAVVFAIAAAAASVIGVIGPPGDEGQTILTWALTGLVPLVPGIVAAGPTTRPDPGAPGSTPGRLLQSTELAVVGATPLFAVATNGYPYLFPLVLWLGAIALAGRFTVRPLARLVTRAQLQRDLVVAATEAERARLAADIHDDALQELTLLVRRLEAAGDDEGAAIGRTVADRLRAICGDLRLPILDDLGVGPALDWLVLRIERLAGGEVRLERADDVRHSPDVELAFFRVAQEALANAVKHGSPPIVVRYQSTASGVSLSIDDSGPGITPDAGAAAEREGHYGLLNMQQRAEAIGAILDVRRWPTGGTHVALEWRPR